MASKLKKLRRKTTQNTSSRKNSNALIVIYKHYWYSSYVIQVYVPSIEQQKLFHCGQKILSCSQVPLLWMTMLFHLLELHPGYKTRFLETLLPNFSPSLALLPCSSTPDALCALPNVLYATWILLPFIAIQSPRVLSLSCSISLAFLQVFICAAPSFCSSFMIHLSSSGGKSRTSAEVQKCLHLHSLLFPAVNFQQSRGVWHRPTKKTASFSPLLLVCFCFLWCYF